MQILSHIIDNDRINTSTVEMLNFTHVCIFTEFKETESSLRKVQLRMAEAEKRMREDDFISDKMLLMGGDEFGDEADIIGAYPRGGGMPGGRLRGE